MKSHFMPRLVLVKSQAGDLHGRGRSWNGPGARCSGSVLNPGINGLDGLDSVLNQWKITPN